MKNRISIPPWLQEARNTVLSIALGLATLTPIAAVQAQAPLATVEIGPIIRNQLAIGVAGPNDKSDEIALEPEGPEALVVDFGEPVTDVYVTFGFLWVSEGNGGNCRENARWTGFNSAGEQVAQGDVPATSNAVGSGDERARVAGDDEPIRFAAFSSLPLDTNPNGGGTCNLGSEDSDFTIVKLEYNDSAGAQQITGEADGSGLSPLSLDDFYAYAAGDNFVDDENGFLVAPGDDDLPLGEEDVVFEIDLEVCDDDGEGGAGTGPGTSECTVSPTPELDITFENDGGVTGSFEVISANRIRDPRGICGGDTVTGDDYYIIRGDGSLELTGYPGNGGNLVIPPELCGIPDDSQGGGDPYFFLIDLDSSLLTVSSSLISFEISNPADRGPGEAGRNTAYACKFPVDVVDDGDRSTQPVFGWLPKPGEIPVLDSQGAAVNVLEDLTNGCSSYRGGTGRMSYLAYDLHHVEDADYAGITLADIEQLKVTLQQAVPCVPDEEGKIESTANSLVRKVGKSVEMGDYDEAVALLLEFGALLDPPADLDYPTELPKSFKGESLAERIADCFYVNATPPVQPPPGDIPRNFRGDLLSQVEHIRYMLVTMLGAEEPGEEAEQAAPSPGNGKAKGKNK